MKDFLSISFSSPYNFLKYSSYTECQKDMHWYLLDLKEETYASSHKDEEIFPGFQIVLGVGWSIPLMLRYLDISAFLSASHPWIFHVENIWLNYLQPKVIFLLESCSIDSDSWILILTWYTWFWKPHQLPLEIIPCSFFLPKELLYLTGNLSLIGLFSKFHPVSFPLMPVNLLNYIYNCVMVLNK